MLSQSGVVCECMGISLDLWNTFWNIRPPWFVTKRYTTSLFNRAQTFIEDLRARRTYVFKVSVRMPDVLMLRYLNEYINEHPPIRTVLCIAAQAPFIFQDQIQWNSKEVLYTKDYVSIRIFPQLHFCLRLDQALESFWHELGVETQGKPQLCERDELLLSESMPSV